jgi:putative intracellular protease/amidase
MVWHAETALPPDLDLIVLPGGFSYGDYLRCGAMAALSPVMVEVRKAAERGVAVVGICNGFQVLCESGLLPGALLRNSALKYVCKPVDLDIVRPDTRFTRAFGSRRRAVMTVGNGEGAFFADADTLSRVEGEGQELGHHLAQLGDAVLAFDLILGVGVLGGDLAFGQDAQGEGLTHPLGDRVEADDAGLFEAGRDMALDANAAGGFGAQAQLG